MTHFFIFSHISQKNRLNQKSVLIETVLLEEFLYFANSSPTAHIIGTLDSRASFFFSIGGNFQPPKKCTKIQSQSNFCLIVYLVQCNAERSKSRRWLMSHSRGATTCILDMLILPGSKQSALFVRWASVHCCQTCIEKCPLFLTKFTFEQILTQTLALLKLPVQLASTIRVWFCYPH